MSTVLIIDDNADHRAIYRLWMVHSGYEVIEAANGTEGVQRTIVDAPNCIVMDYLIGAENGFSLLHQMLRDIPGCPPIIFVTCALTESLKRNATALGATACFDKTTMGMDELLDAIRVAVC